ncbi:hypothetical protein BGZ83_007963 [Gryganskiella cystojenkinii]|nr:hypothetical protein BGZ83_007963 [Gryganskiella cystojenkinii]
MAIVTYCVEYAQSQKSTCLKCNKIIPNKSLRCGRMERQSEKEKKKFAKFRWYHFKCFEVPEILTKIPVHLIRGQKDLLDKDKVRLERVIKLGVGASWGQIVDQHKKKVKEDEEAAAAEALENGTEVPVKAKDDVMDTDEEDAEDAKRDFTAALTGEVDKKQERKNRKVNKALKAKTEGAKVAKKTPASKGGKHFGSSSSTTASATAAKPMSDVAKAIAANKAKSAQKLSSLQNKFGKK